MTTPSTSRKTLQSFHARMSLWELFVRRAAELECSVDYLVNEAMRLYAMTHGLMRDDGDAPVAEPAPPRVLDDDIEALEPDVDELHDLEDLDDDAPLVPTLVPAAPQPMVSFLDATTGPSPFVAPPADEEIPAPGPRLLDRSSVPPPPAKRPSLPPLPRPGGGGGALPKPEGLGTGSEARRPTLTLIFQGNKLPVTGDQFIIGRGSKSSDLAIKDANISRKHAAIIFHNGAFYLKDLGSTNGVEFRGKQVDSKRIDEGDVFTICGYELHFTFQV